MVPRVPRTGLVYTCEAGKQCSRPWALRTVLMKNEFASLRMNCLTPCLWKRRIVSFIPGSMRAFFM